MENRGRRKIYLASFFVFAILAVVLIFFAQGYQVNLREGKIFKAGIVVINTNPKGAEVYLNGHKQSDQTPATLRDITPGDYTVTIKKEGYLDVEQHITVNTEKVNHDLENLELFVKDNPLNQITSKNTKNFFLSSDQSKVLYLTESENKEQLFLLDLNKNKLTEISQQAEGLSSAEIEAWSENNQQFVLSTNQENYYLGDTGKKTLAPMTNIPVGIKKVEWHPQNQKRLLLLAGEELYLYNLETKNSPEKLILSNILGLSKVKNNLFALAYDLKDSTESFAGQVNKGILYQIDGNGKKEETIAENLPLGTIEKMAIRNEEKLILAEKEIILLIQSSGSKNTLLVINPKNNTQNGDKISAIDQDVKDFSLSKDNEKIIFSKNNELFAYNFSEKKTTLITRLQEKINQFYLHKTNPNYIYLWSEKQLKAVEQKGLLSQTIFDFGGMPAPKINYIKEQNYFLILGNKQKDYGDLYELYPQGQE